MAQGRPLRLRSHGHRPPLDRPARAGRQETEGGRHAGPARPGGGRLDGAQAGRRPGGVGGARAALARDARWLGPTATPAGPGPATAHRRQAPLVVRRPTAPGLPLPAPPPRRATAARPSHPAHPLRLHDHRHPPRQSSGRRARLRAPAGPSEPTSARHLSRGGPWPGAAPSGPDARTGTRGLVPGTGGAAAAPSPGQRRSRRRRGSPSGRRAWSPRSSRRTHITPTRSCLEAWR